MGRRTAPINQLRAVLLERGSQVHFMAEFQELLDFPPAPKLDKTRNRLDPSKANEAELRGEALFFGKAQCSTCHPAPYYTDNLMHNLKVERFFKEVTINGRKASADGPINLYNAVMYDGLAYANAWSAKRGRSPR